MTTLARSRRWTIRTALSLLHTPYVWGGDDPAGFDCSGFVIYCLQAGGCLPTDYDTTADGLYRRFYSCSVTVARTGCLIFRFGSDGRARHVDLVLDSEFAIGARGGNRAITTERQALAVNASVCIRPLPSDLDRYRLVDPFQTV